MCRGGSLISSRVICPAVTASRCSATQSMCQLSRNVVPGSMTSQACRMKCLSFRSASSFWIAARSSSLASESFKLLQLLGAEVL